MRAVYWSDDALDDFDRAIHFIAAESPPAATLVADRIEQAVQNLAEMPTGHTGRITGTFEKLVPKTPYILAYALDESGITILRVIHGRRQWPAGSWPVD